MTANRIVIVLFVSICISASSGRSAAAVIGLGNAGNYALFGLGSTVAIGAADSVTDNTAEIYGNVAVGADTSSVTASGNGTFQKGFIQGGSLYVDGPVTPATYTVVNKNFTVSGGIFGTVPANPGPNPDSTGTGTFDLVPAVLDAENASTTYAALPGQTALGNYDFGSGTHTLAAGVYSATDFSINSHTTFVINGGPTDIFVLNDSGGFSFDKSYMQLTGGITSNNVLFNVTGTGTTATVSGTESLFYGTLLGVSRNITIDGIGSGSAQGVSAGPDGIPGTADDNTGLEGRVIVSLSTNSTTLDLIDHSGGEINLPVPEPSSLGLLSLGLLCFARRRRRVG
jgi:hypothetical protein